MNDLIEKLEEDRQFWLNESKKNTSERDLAIGVRRGLGIALHRVKSHPAITAREKAKKVADHLGLQPDETAFFFKPTEHRQKWSYVSLTGIAYLASNLSKEIDGMLELTPTPEEIATGCCCYVVPEKGETM